MCVRRNAAQLFVKRVIAKCAKKLKRRQRMERPNNYWNYRVVAYSQRLGEETRVFYRFAEVYYYEGRIVGFGNSPFDHCAETIEELEKLLIAETVNLYAAFNKPLLTQENEQLRETS